MMATAGMSNSPSCDFEESDIIEIVPAEEYDSQRAKLRASIAWLASKAYGKQVPRDLLDPFYENSEGQLTLRPVLINLLSSSELYCMVCNKIFPETHTQWRGHWSIIQVLSRKGIYIADVQDSAVTETVLVQTAPFKLKAHLALMDALMRAYLSEVASVEKVVKAVRRITSFNASTELPGSPEESLEFWVNKVGQSLSSSGSKKSSEEGQLIEGETSQKVRILTKSPSPRDQPTPQGSVTVPLMEDLMRDIGDGCAIAAVIAYYRPNQLSVADICLKSQIGIADSLYNLRQISIFCKSHLPWASFHLSYEDFLYTHETMRVNLYTFVADLFYAFETIARAPVENVDFIPAAGRKSGQSFSTVPISNATKKSFQKLPLEDTAANLGMTQRSPVGTSSSHQPLLPRRAAVGNGGNEYQTFPARRGRRVQSLSTPQDRDLIHRSVIAWQDDQRLSTRTSSEGELLLSNVSIDSNLDQSMELDAGLSLELAELDSPRVPNQSALDDPNHPDYMEVESIPSSHPTTRQAFSRTNTPYEPQQQQHQQQSGEREPLMPAVLRPTKEKVMSKAEERGDRDVRKKATSSPQSPSQPVIVHARDESINSSWSDETCVTPLPSGEGQRTNEGHQQPMSQPSQDQTPRNQYEYDAFVLGAETLKPVPSSQSSPPQSARSDAPSVAESYTVPDRPQTALEAVRAGIPIVPEGEEGMSQSRGNPSREGSVASSGEYSDHESLKIHQDHKNRESSPSSQPLSTTGQQDQLSERNVQRDGQSMLITDQISGDVKKTSSLSSNTTNFAELKRLKDLKSQNIDKVDNSGLIYMQTGIQWDVNPDAQAGGFGSNPPQPGQQQSQRVDGGGGGKPTVSFQSFPQSPQQPINSQNGAVDGLGGGDADSSARNGGVETRSSELEQLRLKLEQKRKEIERKKHRMEAQQNKMRQKLGKAAFMRVVSKHMDGPESDGVPNTSSRVEPSATSTHAQLQARLGHPGPRLPLSSSTLPPSSTMPSSSSYPHYHTMNPVSSASMSQQQIYLGGQSTHPTLQDSSGQRLTNWSTQSQLAKENKAQQFSSQNATTISQPGDRNGGSQWETGSGSDGSSVASNASSNSSNAQRSSDMTKAFSREGIQQTIDNIKNRWFKNDDSDLISTGRCENDEDDVDRDAFSHPQRYPVQESPRVLHTRSLSPPRSKPVNQGTPSSQHNTTPTPSHVQMGSSPAAYYNQDPSHIPAFRQAATTRASSTPPVYVPVSSTSHTRPMSDQDSSFDKLSCSLTDLQEEIMGMSLQNEQLQSPGQPGYNQDVMRMSDALAAIRGAPIRPVAPGPTNRPIHGIPHQAPYIRRSVTPSREFKQPMVSGENGVTTPTPTTSNVPCQPQQPTVVAAEATPQPFTLYDASPGPLPMSMLQHENQESQSSDSTGFPSSNTGSDAIPKDGFFISFGDDSQPRRPKPKLSDRSSGETPPSKKTTSDAVAPVVTTPTQGASLTPQVLDMVDKTSLTPKVLDRVDRDRERSLSPHVGFMVTDPADTQEKGGDSEMQKKKIKLLEMQRKRKEDQERKRQEKEAEMAKKQEEKQLKEEEAERKKADDKARREVIFQQYMQKKNEEEEGVPTPVKPRPERRSGSKPRPKSMFVKSKAMTPEPGAKGGWDSANSSQEDLAGRGDGRRGSPSLMSAMRSSYHFRSPGKISMRKSVSCNTLPQNGSVGGGASTYRRPPSPDLYRIRQQRQRGNSQDSGSETGSGSNPGSDYAGPKLFVKPSAKSNRHIIVNAISHCCLAGSVNTDTKNKVLQEMSKCDANHFLILFRDAGCKYRGLFIFYPDTEEAYKIHGVGPKHITNDMCEKFYKYNSGAKSFTEIVSTKHLSVSVDAVVLQGSVWKTSRAAIRR